jgi:hypothetical protein
MLSSEKDSYAALQELTGSQNDQRPLVLWVGAGVSAWAGFPLWHGLASSMHTKFSRSCTTYDKALALKELTSSNFPAVFELMKRGNTQLYFRELADVFNLRAPSAVYYRLLRALGKIKPLHIFTTNVDEVLEQNLPSIITIQGSDIERVTRLFHQRESFVCKLHGTSSSVGSMVFASSDYDALTANSTYLDVLKEVFSTATVVFIGYGLRDQYLLELLSRADKDRSIFGVGPHYVVSSANDLQLPRAVRQIKYLAEHADHRDALLVLELLVETRSGEAKKSDSDQFKVKPSTAIKSIYYLADLLPAVGTFTTSQTATLAGPDGAVSGEFISGDGYVQSEIQITGYSAAHDLIVGLLCFDTVCFDTSRLGIVHTLLGSEIFWQLLRLEALQVVDIREQSVVLFSVGDPITGVLTDITMGDSTKQSVDGEPMVPMSIDAVIRRYLQPAVGKEALAEEQFEFLAKSAFKVVSADLKTGFSEQARLALVNPSIRKLLGVSLGTPHGVVPRWVAFPILRLARLMSTGAVCQAINASATRMIWGAERLATTAFSSAAGKTWADDAASYVLTGKFNSDVGSIVTKNPALLSRLLEFRLSQQGENFRKEISSVLQSDQGAQVAAAVNAGLKTALTPSVLEQAKNQFSGLFTLEHGGSMLPAVWGDLQNGEARIAKWRERSRLMLREEMRKHNWSPYSACPCGSGEPLKFCCLEALSS